VPNGANYRPGTEQNLLEQPMSPSPAGRYQPSYPGAPRSRRALLKLGFASAAALVVNACGGSSKSAATTASAAGTTAVSAGPAAPATTAGATTTAGAASAPVADPIPTGSKLTIDFTFTPGTSGFGPVRNPYVAVWIEDAKGLVARTLLVTFNQREQKYLQELRRWFTGEQAREDAGGAQLTSTVSGATRVPGAYSVVWDGLDDAGRALGLGDYFVCIEAAREHGPYALVRDAVTIGKDPFQKPLTANGEIPSAAVDFKPV
jgi:hypothetical protein